MVSGNEEGGSVIREDEMLIPTSYGAFRTESLPHHKQVERKTAHNDKFVSKSTFRLGRNE